MNYYDETLTKLKSLVKEKKYDEALKIINEELSLAYVPLEFEKDLIYLKQEIASLKGPENNHNFTAEKLFQKISDPNKPVEEKIGYFSSLENFNLRNFIEEIQTFLNSSNPNELKTILIYLLINQEINHEFNYQVNNQNVSINPISFNLKSSEQFISELTKEVEKNLPKDYVQLESMSKMVIASFYYKMFPLFDNLNIENLAKAIVNRLVNANGIETNLELNKQIEEYEHLLMNLKII